MTKIPHSCFLLFISMEISVEPQMVSRFHPQRYFETKRGKSLHWRASNGPVRQGRKGCSPHPPSTPLVPPGVAAEFPSFPWSAVGNLLSSVQYALSIFKCSLKTNLQDLPEHPQKVCRPLVLKSDKSCRWGLAGMVSIS